MKIMILAAAATFFFSFTLVSPAAHAAPTNRNVVRSEHDSVVQTKTGSCVRTHWASASDPCAPPPPPPPPVVMAPPPPRPVVMAPPPPPRTIVQKDERTVYFDFNKAVLRTDAMQRLDQLALILKNARDIQRADIVGYADPMGNKTYNYALSERRAQAVESYLHQRGYLSTRRAEIRAVGDTEAQGECPRKMKRSKRIECFSPDRKVEVEIVYTTLTR